MTRIEDHAGARSGASVAIALIAVVGAASCRRQPARSLPPVVGVPSTTVSSNRFAGTPQARWPDDAVRAAVTAAERAELGPDAAAKVGVKVADGIVSLSGILDDLLERRASVAAAESVRGVRAVVDDLTVQVARRPDAAIAKDVRRSLATRAPERTQGLRVRVSRGVVTLTGTISSGLDLELASHLAAGVAGVAQIRTDASVRVGEGRADREIVADIRDRLRWSLPLEAKQLTVTSAGGNVILTGAVATPQDRLRAAHLAWVTGVRHVASDAVIVEPSAFPREPSPPVPAGANDAAIAKAVRDAIFYDPRVYAADVGVDVAAAVVTLRGHPSTAYEARAALEDARATAGVTRVADLMKVRPASPVSDVELEREVARALATDSIVDLGNVTVTVADGVAMLRGEVPGLLAHARAVEIASAVPGVRAVGDGIVIATGRAREQRGALGPRARGPRFVVEAQHRRSSGP